MRGADQRNDTLFSYVRPDSRVPPNHPLRAIRRITDRALTSLSDRFDAMYSEIGRPSIPPEKLLRAAVASVLLDPFGAAIDGADGLQPSVPLVCWPVGGPAGLGPHGVQQEPRPNAGRRRRRRLHGRGSEPR